VFQFFIKNIEDITEEEYQLYFLQLPQHMQRDISKYKFKKDRYRTLVGKSILLEYLKKYTNYSIFDIKKTIYGKPYIEGGNINFNISHSGKYVVAVFGEYEQIGIDIEDSANRVDLEDFKLVLLESEFNQIKNSKNQLERFYTFWTIKEATLKANGKGLIDDMREIIIEDNKIYFRDKIYTVTTSKIGSYIYSIVFL